MDAQERFIDKMHICILQLINPDMAIVYYGIITVKSRKMFAYPFDQYRHLHFFPVGITNGIILKTPTISKIAVIVPHHIVVDIKPNTIQTFI